MYTFEVFKEEVIAFYRDKKRQHKLHSNLENPSPGNLRQLSLILFTNGLSPEDDQTFRMFFNPLNPNTDLETSIKKFELDRFRPLRNFILGHANNPREETVKFLAIIVNFEPRPYDKWKKMNNPTIVENKAAATAEEESSEIKPKQDSLITEQMIIPSNDVNKSKSTIKTKYLAAMSSIGLFIGIFLFMNYGIMQKQCMYWNVDHYTPINCKEKIAGSKIIALDEHKLNNFRRITRPDTLTIKDVNKVWYSKINNNVEFFTEAGHHPIHDKPLKAMTTYILNEYALTTNL